MNANNFSKLFIVTLLSIFTNFGFSQSIPTAPTGLRITSSDCGIINLAWDDYPPEIQEIGYRIFVSENGETGSYSHIIDVMGNTTNYKYEINNILQNHFYYFKIKSIFDNAESDFTSPISTKFICSPPLNFNASPVCGGFNLSWDRYVNPLWEVEIFRSSDGINFASIFSLGYNTHFYDQIYDFIPNGTYYYKTRAKHFQLTSEFSEVTSVIYNCPPPNNLRITNSFCGRIDLDWDEEPKDLVVRMDVFRSKNGINGDFVYYANTIYEFQDNGYSDDLLVGSTYHYKVRYQGGNGFSNIISGSVDCATPKNLGINPLDCNINPLTNSIQLHWRYYATFDLGLKIYRSINGPDGDYIFLANSSSYAGTYTDNTVDLSSGHVYHYKIQYEGETTFSNIASNSFTMSTVKSGSWTDPTVWSCGRIPNSGDIILIDFYHNINIDDNIVAKAKNLTNRWQLSFGVGSSLILTTP